MNNVTNNENYPLGHEFKVDTDWGDPIQYRVVDIHAPEINGNADDFAIMSVEDPNQTYAILGWDEVFQTEVLGKAIYPAGFVWIQDITP